MAMPVARLSSGFGGTIDSAKFVGMQINLSRWFSTYRTVRASSSIGAPERTAAGSTSVSSLPFMTLFGTGEKVLVKGKPSN